MSLAGVEAIQRSKNFEYRNAIVDATGAVTTPAESRENPDIFLQKFRELCNPQTNISMERHTFFTRNQAEGESVEKIFIRSESKSK